MELSEPSQERFPRSHPTSIQKRVSAPSEDWSVEDIVKWLKSKGINEDVVDELRREASKQRGDPSPDEGKRQGTEPKIEAQWLLELHNKLWGREDLFFQVFRAVDLTKEDFIELQSILHDLNPSRNHKNYLTEQKNILETKMNFLRSRTATHPLTSNTDSLVPKVVLEGRIPAGAMDVDVDVKSDREDATDDKDEMDGEDAMDEEADEGEFVDEDDKSYIDEDAAALSHGPTPVFPCTIRYMDLTCLNLQDFFRVSEVLLIRDEWDAVVNIFNEGEMGRRGGSVWTGQPGIGKTALLYFILVTCLIKAQPFVFQSMTGIVYIIGDEVRQQMVSPGQVVKVPGADVLALVDGDGNSCLPSNSILTASNLRILLISSPRNRKDRRWLTQYVQDPDASYVVGPWQWNEFAVASIFLSELDITLRRLRKAVKFCGFNPRPVFKAVESPGELVKAEYKLRTAINNCANIGRAIEDVHGDLPVPHHAFMIYPGDEGRSLLMSLVKPVSDWALGVIFGKLESRGAEAAYELYRRIEGYPHASAFREQLWEHQVQRYFCSGNLPSFTIQSLEDGASSTMEWNPFKNMSTFNFGPSKRILVGHLHECIATKRAGYFRPKSKNFESFESIIYEPKKPLVGVQITENPIHPIKTGGPVLLEELLSPSDLALRPLRPVVAKPWIILFVIPIPMQTTFKKQKFETNAAIWQKKTSQYVLGLDKYAVFHCSPQSSSQ